MKISLMLVHDYYEGADRSADDLVQESIRHAQLADNLDYDGVWIAEHHFSNYGIVPNPAVLLSYLAATTHRVKLGPSVAVLPYHDPRTIAETYAMVDQMSGGRLRLGVGAGFQPVEYAAYDVDIAHRSARFDECLSAVRALLGDERCQLHGEHYRVDDVALNVRPAQRDVQICVATNRAAGAADIGALGLDVLCMPYAGFEQSAEIAGYLESFRGARHAAGRPATEDSAHFGFHTYVGESGAEARETAGEAFDRYMAVRTGARQRSYEDVVASGLVIFGDAASVRDQLVHLMDLGVANIMAIQAFGLIAADKVDASMIRMSQEVLPSLRQHASTLAASAPRSMTEEPAA